MDKIWRCGTFDIDMSKPQVMGIVNVTPDSFSDGGNYATTERAVAHARELIAQGATIIDIGGESTRPGAIAPSIAEEIARVVPVIEQLADCGVPLSVDTRHAAVARAAVEAGVHIINDISGFKDPDMVQVAAFSDAGLVIMHMQGTPENMQKNPHYDDVAREVRTYLRSRADELTRFGVEHARICLDPGFGFGKTYAHNLELMAGMSRIVDLGYPVLIGISRKSYIGALLGIEVPKDRDEASAQIALDLVERGARIVRVHNVALTVETLANAQKTRHTAYVALGSNIDEKLKNLRTALAHISQIPGTKITACSHAYESEPAYKEDQDTFANAVVRVETALPAFAFFAELQAVEATMGRIKTEENGPRNIDLDLLAFDDETISLPGLVVPHKDMQERDFVMTPLLEIAPNFKTPDGKILTKKEVRYGHITKTLGEICSSALMGTGKGRGKAKKNNTSQKAGKGLSLGLGAKKQGATSNAADAANEAEQEPLDGTTKMRMLQEKLRLTKVTVAVGIVIALLCLFMASATLWWVTTPQYAVELSINATTPRGWFAKQQLRWSLLQSDTKNDGTTATVDYRPSDGANAATYRLSRQSDGGWRIDTIKQAAAQ